MTRTCLSIILAAGDGLRMQSSCPKVLHPVGSLPIIAHVIRNIVSAFSTQDIAVVLGDHFEDISKIVKHFAAHATFCLQKERKGTADAVLSVKDLLSSGLYEDIFIFYGDTPFVEATAIFAIQEELKKGCSVVVGGFHASNPSFYGRILKNKDGDILAIREDKDCSKQEKEITFCNAGVMGIAGKDILFLLEKVTPFNQKGEYYLTDIVAIACKENLNIGEVVLDPKCALGINTRLDLREAENIWQEQKRKEMIVSGVTLLAPETVFFSYDTFIGVDSIVEPYVYFGENVHIQDNVRIRSFSYIEGTSIASFSQIGPYTRLRPGVSLEKNVKVGNFVEIKQSLVQEGTKINHLSYIGDAEIGAFANIGAGVVTCNYDGYAKFFTHIGEKSFIGSNSSLVAPVSIGKEAYIASGSVITEDVPPDSLAFGRARQVTFLDKDSKLKRSKHFKESQ